MPDRTYREYPITFEKGMILEVSDSLLEANEAAEILNYEPTLKGSLRPRNSWVKASTEGLPAAPWKVVGIGKMALPGQPFVVKRTNDVAFSGVTPVTVSLSNVKPGNRVVVIGGLTSSSTQNVVYDNLGGFTSRSTAGWATLLDKVSSGGTESVTLHATSTASGSVMMLEFTGLGDFLRVTNDPSSSTPSIAADADSLVLSSHKSGLTDSSTEWTTILTGTIRVYKRRYLPTAGTVSHSLSGVGDKMTVMGNYRNAALTMVYLVIALDRGNKYEVYRTPISSLESGTWELIDSVTGVDSSKRVSFAQGAGNLVWTSISKLRRYDMSSSTASDITGPTPGRTVVYHKNRFFVGGSKSFPYRLYFSDFNSASSWPAANFVDIGADDGEDIEDLISTENMLLIAKTESLYTLQGSGVESFFLAKVQGGEASTGYVLSANPFSTTVAGKRWVWNFESGAVDPLSRPIGVNYVASNTSIGYSDDKVYVVEDLIGRVYVFNVVSGAWWKEDLPAGMMKSFEDTLFFGAKESGDFAVAFRSRNTSRTPDAIRTQVAYRATTGKLLLEGPGVFYTPRFVYVLLRLDEDSSNVATLKLTVAGPRGLSRDFTVQQVGKGIQHKRFDVGFFRGQPWMQLTFEQTAVPGQQVFHIERVVLGVEVQEVR
jgi:hypothetical protein